MSEQNTSGNVQANLVVDGLLREVSDLTRRVVIAEAMYAQVVAGQRDKVEASNGDA